MQHPSVTKACHVMSAEVFRILGSSRAVVVPSQWEESFGMVAVEAMAVGTTPVASAQGSSSSSGAWPRGCLSVPEGCAALRHGAQHPDSKVPRSPAAGIIRGAAY
jgi:hypothetical protein